MFRKRWLPLLALAGLGLGLAVIILSPGGDRQSREVATLEPKVEVSTGTQVPVETATSPESNPGLGILRLVVPGLKIDAPMVELGVDTDGVMQSPSGPSEVGWYNFSSLPGQGKNIVVSGHVDYINHGPAVFYKLRDAREGDVFQLLLEDQSIATYKLTSIKDYDANNAPVQEIVGPTDVETLTMITCGGSFDPKTRQYDRRLILRAIRS